MEGEISPARVAVVSFGSAAAADRRIAGVAAVGRLVRELAERGFAEARIGLGRDERLSASAEEDVARLAGEMRVIVAADAALPRFGAECEVVAPDLPQASEVMRATGKSGDGLISRWLNRPVSRRISSLLLRIPGARPIHATAGTALLGLAMGAALLSGGAGGLLAGGLLFHAASVFDGVDGEMARATFRQSRVGAALDTAIDAATNLLFILGVTVNLSRTHGAPAIWLGGWGLGLFAIGLAALALRVRRGPGPFRLDLLKHEYRDRFSGRIVPFLIRFLTVVSSRDFFALLFALLILAGFPMAVLAIFALAATVWIGFVAARLLPRPADSTARTA